MLIIYTKDGCSQCTIVKNYLKNKSIEYKEVIVSEEEIEDFARETEMKAFPVTEYEGLFLTSKEVFERF